MKFVFAIILALLSTLAQAQTSVSEQIFSGMEAYRAQLLEAAKPYRHSLVVDELVDKMQMHDVEVIVSAGPVPGGALYFPGVILVGGDLVDLPREQMAFVLAHEYGHHMHADWRSTLSRGLGLASVQGHNVTTMTELLPYLAKAATPEASFHDETEADICGVTRLKQFGLYNQEAIMSLLNALAAPETATHPGAHQRIMAIVNAK